MSQHALLILQKKMLIFFLKKWWGARFFLEEMMTPGLPSHKTCASHYFFRKKSSASLFLQKKIECLFITSEKMLICFWRNKLACCLFCKPGIISPSEKKTNALLFLQKTISMLFLKKHGDTSFFLKKYWCACFFSEEIMRCLGVVAGSARCHHFFWNKSSAALFLQNKRNIFIWRNNEVLSFVSSAGTVLLFLQKKIKCIIISS